MDRSESFSMMVIDMVLGQLAPASFNIESWSVLTGINGKTGAIEDVPSEGVDSPLPGFRRDDR